jgi:hypothetical protein
VYRRNKTVESSRGVDVNRTALVLAGSWLVLAAAGFVVQRAIAQITLTPRVIQIDQVKCAEMRSASDQKTERIMLYFTGYVDGMRRQTVWDDSEVARLVDRVTAYCKANPDQTILSAFTGASR